MLVVFAIIMFSPFPRARTYLLVNVRLSVLSLLAAGLMSTRPGWNFFPILFFLIAPMAMIDLPIKTGLIWVGLFTLITTVVFCAVDGLVGLALLLPFAAGYVFFGIFGWMMVESEHNRARSDQLLAELQGGEFHVDPRAGGGTQITFSIPQVTEVAPRPTDEQCEGARG